MIYYSLIFTFGLFIGSFLNAIIYRLGTGESIVNSRSHCPKCGHVLSWLELMPVISFIFQKGKCKKCSKSISWQYPLVEIGTGFLFTLILNFEFRISSEFLISEFLNTSYLIVISSLLVVIFVFDLKHYMIPDRIIYPAIIIVLLYQVFGVWTFENWDLIQNSKFKIQNLETFLSPLLSAFFASSFFASIFFVSRGKWMGFGDAKLAFFMGLFLGWPNILVALFIAFILGGIMGILLIAARKKSLKSQVPFGPFLIAGTFVSFFWGDWIVRWYLGLIM